MEGSQKFENQKSKKGKSWTFFSFCRLYILLNKESLVGEKKMMRLVVRPCKHLLDTCRKKGRWDLRSCLVWIKLKHLQCFFYVLYIYIKHLRFHRIKIVSIIMKQEEKKNATLFPKAIDYHFTWEHKNKIKILLSPFRVRYDWFSININFYVAVLQFTVTVFKRKIYTARK